VNVVLTFNSQVFTAFDRERVFIPDPTGLLDEQSPGSRMFATIMELSASTSDRGYVRLLVNPSFFQGLAPSEIEDKSRIYLKELYPQLRWDEEYLETTVVDWSKKTPYISPIYFWPPGGGYSKSYPFLMKPFHNIFWAGTERVLQGMHWMEGAVVSGNKVAQQVAAKLGVHDYKSYFKGIKLNKEKALEKIRTRDGLGPDLYTLTGLVDNIFGVRNTHLTKFEEETAHAIKKLVP